MGAVWRRAGAQVRRRWRSWAALSVVVGLGSGFVLAALVGARRTSDAYPNFVDQHAAADVVVPGFNRFGLTGSVDLEQVARNLPQVRDVARADVTLLFAGTTDRGRTLGPADLFPTASPDGVLGTRVERQRLLRGRAADPAAVDEVVVSFVAAEQLHLDVGSTFTLHFFRADTYPTTAATLLTKFGERLRTSDRDGAAALRELADGPRVRFRVVGVEASPSEFPPLLGALAPAVHLTPAFSRQYQANLVTRPQLYVRLWRGAADIPAFQSGVERLALGRAVSFITTRPNQTAKVQRAIHVETTAARVLAAIGAAALVVLVGQALVRQAQAEAEDDDTLQALGMTGRQLLAVALVRGLTIATVGAVLAVGFAVATSPLTPIGLARMAETDPGLHADAPVLLTGGLAVFAVTLVLALLPATRLDFRRRRATGRASSRPLLPAGGLPSSARVGLRFALDRGRGSTSFPLAATLFGVALGSAILIGVAGFNTNLQHLLDTPRLYGWNWSAYIGAPGLPDIGDSLTPALRDDRHISSVAVGTVALVRLDAVRVDILAVDQERGRVLPPITAGRAPRAPGEVAVGATTLRALHKGIGDTVTATVGSREVPLRIVGRVVLPDIGDAGEMGTGALTSFEDAARLVDDARHNVFLVRFRPGVDERETARALRSALAPLPTHTAERPDDLQAITRINSLPNLLSLVLAAIAAAALGHTVVTSVRRRRRDLAVLKSMGFVRRQVSAAVLWQATALTAVALAVGLPLGVGAGRWAWTVFAGRLGIVSEPVGPSPLLVLYVPAVLLVANVLAAPPALDAGRTPPAVVLRAE